MTGYTLTEIEEGAQVLTNTTGACNPESVILLPSAHYHWLLARVRELEAQAARDAEVTAAADEYLDARIAIQQAEGVSWPEKAAALRAAEIALMSAAGKRRAALAAREEAE